MTKTKKKGKPSLNGVKAAKRTETRTVKAWAILESGVFCEAYRLQKTAEQKLWDDHEYVVPCTITYTVPTQRRR